MQAERQGWQTRHSVITGVGVTAGAVLGLSSPALAADYTVTSTVDPVPGACDADCSLREAVLAANATTAYDRIFFQSGLSGTIALSGLSGGQIPITESVYIEGPGPGEITVSGNNTSRIFDVDPATSGDLVRIGGLTLADGNASGGDDDGGAIRNEDAELFVIHSVLSGNTASGNGGAIYHYGGDPDAGASNHIVYSTLSGNTASSGGGVHGNESVGTIGTSTLSGNNATGGPGGGVSAGGGQLWIYNSTVAGNTAATSGGGLHSSSASGIRFFNSIAADNTAASNLDVHSYLDSSFSLVENPGTSTIGGVGPNIVGQDPQLGALASNGGLTPTRKPAATSPVVDRGFSSPTPDFDQRLFSRPVDNPNAANAPGGDGTDIGSVELRLAEGPQAPPAPPAPPPPAPPPPASAPAFDLQAAIKKCKKKVPKGPRRTKCIKKARAKAQA